MLVLSRKVGQSIVINNRVVVTILQHGKTRVRLGVDAPTDVRIARGTSSPIGGRSDGRRLEADAKQNRDLAESPPPAAA